MGEYGAADEIAKLADLKERGLLSEAEFETQRKRILKGTGGGGNRRVPALVIVGIVIVLVALTVGLLEGTSSSPSKNASGNSTVHLSLASETKPEDSAVNWAKSMVNSPLGRYDQKYWLGCLAFVFDAWGIGAGHSIRPQVTFTPTIYTYPSEVWGHIWGGTTGTDKNPPAGALVFWNSTITYKDSHVALSIGGGKLISTNVDQSSVPGYNGIHEESMTQFGTNTSPYEGWWLPDGTKASPPKIAVGPTKAPSASKPATSSNSGGGSSGPATTPSPTSIKPPASSSSGGSGSSTSTGSGGNSTPPAGGGVSSGSPAGGGSATPSGGGTSSGSPSGGVSSSGPSTVTPPTPGQTSPPPTALQTWSETVGGDAQTWTNYTNAGGNEGPTIPSNHTVQIGCKIAGFRVQDGDTWWYRIAQSPWDNHYYVSADAFYNNGATSGSLHGTPYVDPAVPNC